MRRRVQSSRRSSSLTRSRTVLRSAAAYSLLLKPQEISATHAPQRLSERQWKSAANSVERADDLLGSGDLFSSAAARPARRSSSTAKRRQRRVLRKKRETKTRRREDLTSTGRSWKQQSWTSWRACSKLKWLLKSSSSALRMLQTPALSVSPRRLELFKQLLMS